MLHGKALGVLTAWDMYCEVTEGKLDPDWKIKDPMDYYTFRDSYVLFYFLLLPAAL
jgi:hypothetical protein